MEMNITHYPHPLNAQAREEYHANWDLGRTIREHLISCGIDTNREIVIYYNSRLLKVAEWDIICPIPGDIINIETVVSGGDGSNPIATILSIIVMIYAPYLAYGLYGAMGGTMTAAAFAASSVGMAMAAAIAITGNMIISALFKPSLASSASGSIDSVSPTYSLSGGSNKVRPYAPLPVLMGSHRIFPDYGAKPYTEFVGDDQYLYQVFNFGIGNVTLSDLRIGDTLLSSYSDVTIVVAENGVLAGFWGNVDTSEGASLTYDTGWVIRTTSIDTVQISVDIGSTLYSVDKKGRIAQNTVNMEIEYSPIGQNNWQPFIPTGLTAVTQYWSRGYWDNTISDPYYDSEGLYVHGEVISSTWIQVSYDTNVSPAAHTKGGDGGDGTIWRYIPVGTFPHPSNNYASNTSTLSLSGQSSKPLRRTISRSVASGQYDVRVRRTSPDDADTSHQSSTEWLGIRSYQEGVADYTNQTVIGIKIKASGQLNGALEQLSALGVKPTWVWDGLSWDFTTTTNPAWWYLNLARGLRDSAGKILYGGGLEDNQIDIDGIKAWAIFCDANNLNFSAVFDQPTPLADALQTIARCGFASISWATGKLGVVWDAPDQPHVMVFGMANICKGSFEVSYITDNLADEIVVNYNDRYNNWESSQVRVTVPGTAGTPIKTSSIDLMGCTTNAHAAKFANALAAQQYYRRRTITWETDLEGFVCQRGDVVILSHDLTQWGYSGRLMSVNGTTITLNKAVPRSGSTEYLMIQSPDGDTEIFTLPPGSGESDTLLLPTAFVLQSGYTAIDHKWCFSPQPTPGKKVKITSVQPMSETRIKLTATDEFHEYYAAWDGVFTQSPTQTLLNQNGVSVSDLRLTVNQFVVDAFQINRVTASWTQRGSIEHCTVSAWLDGHPYETSTIVKGSAHTIDFSEQTGLVTIEVTPVGSYGPGASITDSIDLVQLPAPAAPTLIVTEGLFAVNLSWTFGDEREDIRATEIWFASINDRTGAVLLTAQPFPATKFDHIGLQPGSGGYYWARVVDTRGNYSDWYPELYTGGLYSVASSDPSFLLDQLQQALGMDQLAAELATPIDLITADENTSGSVNWRINAAKEELQTQINAISGLPTYDPLVSYVIGDVVQYENGMYKAIQATTGNLPTDTNYWNKIGDYTSLVDAIASQSAQINEINNVTVTSDSAAARAISGLQSDMTSAEETISTHSTQISDRYTKAETDSAISSSITLLEASVFNETTGLDSKASITYVDEATADAIETSAISIDQISARLDTGDYAAVKTSASTSASKIEGIESKWTLQVDANGKVAGMALVSGASGTAITMLADKFLFYQPNGSGAGKQVFTMGTVNGVTTLGFDGSAIFDGSIVARHVATNSLTADKIDTRGLTIKDASGNIILSSGIPLNWSHISGQPSTIYNSNISIGSNGTLNGAGGGKVTLSGLGAGTLATKNSVNWNTEIVNIPAFGNFAWLSSITSANISTYIASGAIGTAYIADGNITTAKIGQAQIDTLRLAGNAVTIQQVATGTTSATISHSCSGGSIIIVAAGSVYGRNITEQNSNPGYITLSISVTGYGTVTSTKTPCVEGSLTGATAAWAGPVSAGTRSFTITVGGDYSSIGSCRIAILEAKR